MSKKNNHLLLLRTLSNKELKLFADFLTGVKYKNKDTLKIFHFLSKFHKNKKQLPTDEVMFELVFNHSPTEKTGLNRAKRTIGN